MNDLLSIISSSLSSSEWSNIIISTMLKGMLFLLAAIIINSFIKRASSATRHLIWNLAIIALLLLPILSLIVPVWEVPIISTNSNRGTVLNENLLPAQTDLQSSDLQNNDTNYATKPGEHTSINESSDSKSSQTGGILSKVYLLTNTIFKNLNWSFALFFVWIVGMVLFAVRFLVGNAIIQKAGKQFEPVNDDSINNLVKTCVANLKVNRTIKLYTSEQIAVPITQGWLRPKIILPGEALLWSVNRQRSILLHELAHVKRFDYVWNFIANAVTIIYWFNPLTWYVSHQHYKESENSCDDIVLSNGIKSSDYSQYLVETARLLLSSKLVPRYEMAMARKSFMEGRLLTILNDNKIRNNLKTSYMFLIGLFAFSMTVILACLQVKSGDINIFKNDVLTHAYSFGATDVPEEYLLDDPEGIVVNDQNDVLVLDDYRIKIFDISGKPQTIVGKPGTGPDEFTIVRSITLSPTGYINVRDYFDQTTLISPDFKFLNRKIVVKEPDIEKIIEEEGEERGRLNESVTFSENEHIYNLSIETRENVDRTFPGKHLLLYKHNNIIEKVVKYQNVSGAHVGKASGSVSFRGSFLWELLSERRIAYTHPFFDKMDIEGKWYYKLHITSLADTAIKHIIQPYELVAIPETYSKRIEEFYGNILKRESGAEGLRDKLLELIETDKYLPPICRILADRNRLFVFLMNINKENETQVDIFDLDLNKYLFSTYFPVNDVSHSTSNEYCIKKGYYYYVQHHEDSNDQIEVYNIDPKIYN